MSIQLTIPSKRELKPRIIVFGVGGAGGNAVNNMVAAGLEGVDFVVANTDAQALSLSQADRRIQIGGKLTEGLGAGADPSIGEAAAEESLSEVVDIIQGAHMAFITAGMGGGTGTGAAPVIARTARENGLLTVGVVTKPFDFEGTRRMRLAEQGIEALAREVDTLIIIPNQNLFRIASAQTTFGEAFAMADEVLHSGVSSITDLMIRPGLINLDFADVRAVMKEMGKAMMGTGDAEGENRAIEAAEAAIANPLLEEVSMRGAHGVLINITGGRDMTLYEVDAAANRIRQEVDPDANIIIGSAYNDALSGMIRVSVVATGLDGQAQATVQTDLSEQTSELRGQVITLDRGQESFVEMAFDDEPEGASEAEQALETSSMPASDPVGAQSSAAASEPPKSDLPDFLAERPVMPAKREIPKRSRSFLERVFGRGAPKNEVHQDPIISDEPVSFVDDTEAKGETKGEAMEAPQITTERVAQAAAPDTSEPAPEVSAPPSRSAEPLVAAQTVQEPARPATRQPHLEDETDIDVPDLPTRATASVAPPSAVPAATPAVAITQVPAATKAEAPAEKASTAPIMQANAQADAVAAPSASAVSPSAASTVTTSQTVMSAGGATAYAGEQLDIPTFLRR